MTFETLGLLLAVATTASAQYGGYGGNGGYGGGGGNPYSNGGNGGGNGNGNGFGGSPFGGANSFQSFMNGRQKILIAHGVLAALAFVIFFPVGAILIRLGSFPGAWLVHGLFQLFAYIVYIAAFGIGIWMINNIPINLLGHYHPIIGIVVFVLLFFQPILGFLHHYRFKKYSRRTFWSYSHIWLGRIVVTLGMINGGLGMLLAKETGFFVPNRGQIIAYGVVAGIMWLLYVVAAIIGESRRRRSRRMSDEDVTLKGSPVDRYAYDTRQVPPAYA